MKKENYTNKKQKREKTFSDKLNCIIKNTIAVIIWILIFGKILFNLDIILKLSNSFIGDYFYLYLNTYKYLILLGIIILSAIFFQRKSKLSFIIFYILYLIFFPVIAIVIVAYRLFFVYIPKIAKIYKNILKQIQKIQFQILLFCIDLLCIYLIVRLSNIIGLIIVMVMLAILLILHFLFLFQLITNPLMVLNDLFYYIEKSWIMLRNDSIIKKYFDKKDKTNDLEKIKKDLKQNIKIIAKAFNWLNNKIMNISSKKSVLKFFILVFVVFIVFTITIFSFEYYGLNKINSENFTLLKPLQYFEYFYFSLSIYSTINSDIVPLTIFAKLIVIIQILLGFFLFYIFILSFSTTAFESATKDREKILYGLKKILDYLNDVAKNELDISVENLLQEKFLETTIDSKDKK